MLREDWLEAPTPDLPRLRKVLDHIQAHPEEWEQSTWGRMRMARVRKYFSDRNIGQNEKGTYKYETQCKTTACVAGTTVLLSGYNLAHPKMGSDTSHALIPANDPIIHEVFRRTSGHPSRLTGGGYSVSIASLAQVLLGLTNIEASELFAGTNTWNKVKHIADRIARRGGERL